MRKGNVFTHLCLSVCAHPQLATQRVVCLLGSRRRTLVIIITMIEESSCNCLFRFPFQKDHCEIQVLYLGHTDSHLFKVNGIFSITMFYENSCEFLIWSTCWIVC